MIKRTMCLILLVLCPLSTAVAADWPQWRGPDRTGVSKETGLLESWPAGGSKLLWTFRDAGEGHSSMSVVGDRLYSTGTKDDKEYVYAIDLKTQKKLWSAEIGPHEAGEYHAGLGGTYSTPTIDGKFLYVLGAHGNLICIETAKGGKVWSRNLKTSLGGVRPSYGYSESLLVDGDQVAVSSGGKNWIVAFDKKTGTLKWRTPNNTNPKAEANYSSMIAVKAGGVLQYVMTTRCKPHTVGVRASDGKVLWKGDGLAVDVKGTPIYHNDCVYLSSTFGCQLLKLIPDGDKFKTEEIYSNEEMRNTFSSVILAGEHIYGYSDKWGWMCQDFKTGKTAWKTSPEEITIFWEAPHLGMGKGNVIFADGNLYCYHENKGDVLLLKATPAGYQEQGRFRIPEETKLEPYAGHPQDYRIYAQPALANGKLYLRDQDLIFCYDVHKPW